MAVKNSLRDTLLSRTGLSHPTWESPTNSTSSYGGPTTKLGQVPAPEYPDASQAPRASTGLPVPTPSQPSRVPPAWQRYLTGMQMQNAYASGWQPNPMLLRFLGGS